MEDLAEKITRRDIEVSGAFSAGTFLWTNIP